MRKSRNEMVVGLFVIIGFILLSLIVFFISGVYLFRQGYSVYVMYDYVDIMDKGAPVRMAGVRVGEVSSVDLVPDPGFNRLRVRVKLFLDQHAKIQENYVFEIRGTHVLSEPHIEITPVEGNAPLLHKDSVINGEKLLPIENLIERAHRVSEGLQKSSDTLADILTKVEKGEGTAGKLVSSEELYQDVRGLVQEIKAHPWRLLKKDDKYESKRKKRFLFF